VSSVTSVTTPPSLEKRAAGLASVHVMPPTVTTGVTAAADVVHRGRTAATRRRAICAMRVSAFRGSRIDARM
jgi:hypothetical protein